MAKRKFVVRVAREDRPEFSTPFLECLRYAGHVALHDESMEVFDILCPPGLDSQVWARQNAERMASHGYNAVVAPAWGE
jgi:hypothetical protein